MMPDVILGIGRGIWMLGGGFVLLVASLVIVERFGLARKGLFQPLVANDGNRIAAIAAIVFGLAGGALIFLGTRAG
jgi:hypothetical protein